MVKFFLVATSLTVVVGMGIFLETTSQPEITHTPADPETFVITAPGTVEGVGNEIQLRPQLTGRIDMITVQEGQQVQPNQILLQLDDQQYRHETALAQAQLDQADAKLQRLINGSRLEERQEAAALLRSKLAELEQAQLAYERIRKLRADNAISQQEADNKRTELAAAQAQVEAAKARVDLVNAPPREDEVHMAKADIAAARAQLDLARVQQQRTELRSPTAVQILKVNVEPGELTGPDSETPALIVADTQRYRVRAFVEEFDAPRVRVGMPAIVTADGLPGIELKGHVVRLSPRMGRKQVRTDDPAEHYDIKTREVWIDIEGGNKLVIGLRVDVTIDPTAFTAP